MSPDNRNPGGCNRERLGRIKLLAVAAAAMCWGAAQGQASDQALAQGQVQTLGKGLTLTPTFNLTETWTSNRDLSSVDRRPDYVTQISPGLSMRAGRGPLQGTLSYALNGLIYADQTSLNTVYHTLASQARLSLLDGRAGVEGTATANRQIVSAFGTQSNEQALNNANQTQVFSYSLAPYLTGRLLGNVDYGLRLNYAASHTNETYTGDTSSFSGQANLTGRLGLFDWAFDLSRVIYGSQNRSNSHIGSVGGTLLYTPDVDLQFRARLGSESNDIRTGQSERTTTWGAGVTWRPGPRTNLVADYDRRFFGNAYALGFSHRMSNTIVNFSDSRSLQSAGSTGRTVLSLYDLLFAQTASIEADPVKRDIYVRNLIAANGLDPNGQVIVGGFLSNGPTITRSQVASLAYQGLRMTVSVAFVQTQTRSASVDPLTGDDLANGVRLRQKGATLMVSHRLTPESSVMLSFGEQRTAADINQAANDLRTITATWTARLGQRTTVSLGARRARNTSETTPYQESAVFGTLNLRF